MMQPQSAPQAQATPGLQVAPQPTGQQAQTPQPQGAAPQAQGQTPQQGQPQGKGNFDPKVAALVEQHLNSVPDDQKAFLVSYMTPELAQLFGILLGSDAAQYFSQFADPKKMLTVVPRPDQGQQGAQAPQGQPNQTPQQPTQTAPQPQVQSAQQPQGKAPSIMGV